MNMMANHRPSKAISTALRLAHFSGHHESFTSNRLLRRSAATHYKTDVKNKNQRISNSWIHTSRKYFRILSIHISGSPSTYKQTTIFLRGKFTKKYQCTYYNLCNLYALPLYCTYRGVFSTLTWWNTFRFILPVTQKDHWFNKSFD